MAAFSGSSKSGRAHLRSGVLALLLLSSFSSCRGNGADSQKVLQQDTLPKSKYKVLEFMVDDKPAIALIDTSFKNFDRKKSFPVSVFVTVKTVEKNEKGNPTPKESTVFQTIEDEILYGLNPITLCFIGKTTMNGYRDIIFYIAEKDTEKFSAVLSAVQKKHSRVQSYIFEKDANWEAVSEFYSAMDKMK